MRLFSSREMRVSWLSLVSTLASGQARRYLRWGWLYCRWVFPNIIRSPARFVPTYHLSLKTEAALAETLPMSGGLPANRVIRTRVEELWGLSNEDLCGLGARL